jgi:hypothetical protein
MTGVRVVVGLRAGFQPLVVGLDRLTQAVGLGCDGVVPLALGGWVMAEVGCGDPSVLQRRQVLRCAQDDKFERGDGACALSEAVGFGFG